MSPVLVKHRVVPAARKPRGHDGFKLQRRPQEELAKRSPVFVEVSRGSTFRLESDGAQAAAVVVQLGGENRTVAGKCAVLAEELVDHQLEPIAGLQVHVEVDVAGEDSAAPGRSIVSPA
jgi:hypothetical protein